MVDHGPHGGGVVGGTHGTGGGLDAVDRAGVVGQLDLHRGAGRGIEENHGDGAVVVEVRGEGEHALGQRLHRAVLEVAVHRPRVVDHEVDGGPLAAQPVL